MLQHNGVFTTSAVLACFVFRAAEAAGWFGKLCGSSDIGKTPLPDFFSTEISIHGEKTTVQALCGEDAALAAARVATHKRTSMQDGQQILNLAKKLEAKFDEEKKSGTHGYTPGDTISGGGLEERPRELKTGGQYSRRAMLHVHSGHFKEAIADLVRALLRPNVDSVARDKLMSIMREILEKAQKIRAKKAQDGDLMDLFESLEMEDPGTENKDVDEKKLKGIYRKLSVKYHPDKNPEAAARFNEIRDAYEILNDPVKTMLYDTGGMDLVRKFDGGSDDLERTDGDENQVFVDLQDLYVGTSREVRLPRRVVCRSCRLHPNLPRCKQCKRCPGEMERRQVWINPHQYTVEEHEIPSPEKCTQVTESKPVAIERGMMPGDRVTFHHMGNQMPKKVPGDVVVTVRMRDHPFFKRIGPHLQIVLEITLFEALMGFERELVHLDGHIVKFGVGRGEVIGPEAGIEVEGEGMPVREDPTSFGKLLVKFKIVFPKTIPGGDKAEAALRSVGLTPGHKRAERSEKGVVKVSHVKDEL